MPKEPLTCLIIFCFFPISPFKIDSYPGINPGSIPYDASKISPGRSCLSKFPDEEEHAGVQMHRSGKNEELTFDHIRHEFLGRSTNIKELQFRA